MQSNVPTIFLDLLVISEADGFVDCLDATGEYYSVDAECDQGNAYVKPYCDSSGDRPGKEYDCKYQSGKQKSQQPAKPLIIVRCHYAGLTDGVDCHDNQPDGYCEDESCDKNFFRQHE